jgi:hypothetical protein
MNAIASSTLHCESVIYTFSLTLDSESAMVVSIENRDDTYNGFSSLYEALMDLIPEQLKVQGNERHINRLYHEVKHTMCVTQERPLVLNHTSPPRLS